MSDTLSTLSDLSGVLCHIADIFVLGSTQEEHDARLQAVLELIKQLELL